MTVQYFSCYFPVFSWLLLFAPFRYSEIYEEAFGREDSSVKVAMNGFQLLFNPHMVQPNIENLMQVITIVTVCGLLLQLIAWFFGKTTLMRFLAISVMVVLLIGIKTEIMQAVRWFSLVAFAKIGWGYFALIACQIITFLFVSSHSRCCCNRHQSHLQAFPW